MNSVEKQLRIMDNRKLSSVRFYLDKNLPVIDIESNTASMEFKLFAANYLASRSRLKTRSIGDQLVYCLHHNAAFNYRLISQFPWRTGFSIRRCSHQRNGKLCLLFSLRIFSSASSDCGAEIIAVYKLVPSKYNV